jgi:hypothetical protein
MMRACKMYNDDTAIHTGRNCCITTPLPAKMHQNVRTARETHALLDDSVNTLAASLLSYVSLLSRARRAGRST